MNDTLQRFHFLLIRRTVPGDNIPITETQRERRLPCQRCLHRLSRGGELDRDECLSCDKQVGHVLCDYCSKGRKPCLPKRYTSMRCTPMRRTPSEAHAHEVHTHEVHAHE
jgi:hypothetical protein